MKNEAENNRRHRLMRDKETISQKEPFVSAFLLMSSEQILSFYLYIDRLIEEIPFPEDFTEDDLKRMMAENLEEALLDRREELKDAVKDVINLREGTEEDSLAGVELDESYLKLDNQLVEIQDAITELIRYREEDLPPESLDLECDWIKD